MSDNEGSKNDQKEIQQRQKIVDLINELPVLGKLFDIHFKIGEGTFSSVYLATLKTGNDSKKFAIKHLIPTYPPARIERELQCLRDIGGADNVVGIDFCVRNGASVAFIMPYMRHTKFSDYIYDMDKEELKYYMRALLIALRKVHMFKIIHRDVKPNNFLYDRKNRRYLLVDFGLAQEYKEEKKVEANKSKVEPVETYCVKRKRTDENKRQISEDLRKKSENDNKCYCFGKPRVCSLCLMRPAQVASRAGTPGYRAPEVLFKCPHQTPAIDVWASGVIMLCILSATQPFFRCPDDCTALAEITTLFGTSKMQMCARKLGKKLICNENIPATDIVTLCQKLRARISQKDISKNDSQKGILDQNYPPEAYDLLQKLLEVDYKQRITADEALNHQFLRI